MSGEAQRKLEFVDTGSTARIDRRRSVLVRIEAALLADKLTVMELAQEQVGTDPYNRGPRQDGTGVQRRR